MNSTSSSSLLRCLALILIASSIAYADQWTPPTPEELSMKSQPQVPGAPAVYLFREEITEDGLHMYSTYVRLKVLTEAGKKFGDIEVSYAAGSAGFNITDISGRTIHPDGSIVPFTGKPFEKLIQKGRGYRYMAKVFSMPDVQVGSIIEYRYKLRYDDNVVLPPQWYVQSELFTRKAHFLWKPTNADVNITNERGQVSRGISWTPILPADAHVKESELLGSHLTTFELSVQDVPASPDEEYMPPTSSFTYRVLFYYAAYRTSDEFWKGEGKYWAKARDRFIGPGPAVTVAVHDLAPSNDSSDTKLRKLYAAVQQLENTRFTRTHSSSEDKAQGYTEIRTTDDIWRRKRGTDDQLTELFVAMARAAGFKAYVMGVTNRDQKIFFQSYLSLSQLDDEIAIVNVDGKELYLDPGTKFCPYGHLFWKHTMAGGIRQVDGGGTVIAVTPQENYTDSRVQRVANLTLNEHGSVTGTVRMTYIGIPALQWRQASLEGDAESLRHDLRTSVEALLPRGLEVEFASIEKLAEYEAPLTVSFDIKGVPGSATGKRLLLTADIFEANSTATFPHERRDLPVYFQYSHMVQDAVRINFPKNFVVESLPVDGKLQLQNLAVYNLTTQATGSYFTVRKNLTIGEIIYPVKQYPELRSFYSGMEAKDQQNVVLKLQAPVEEKGATAAN